MNLTRFLRSGFQGQLLKTHRFGPMRFKSHYRVDPLLELDSLKDVVDNFSRNVNFLNSKSRRIFVVFLTINFLIEGPDICFQIDWKNVLLSLLSMKAAFKIIICICDQKLFNNLVITF